MIQRSEIILAFPDRGSQYFCGKKRFCTMPERIGTIYFHREKKHRKILHHGIKNCHNAKRNIMLYDGAIKKVVSSKL